MKNIIAKQHFNYVLILLLTILFSCKKDNETAGDIYNRWEVVDFMSVESVVYPKDNDYNPVIEFKKDGNYLLKPDVNSCSGSFKLGANDSISISLPGCTYMCCDSEFSVKVSVMLPKVKTYSIDGNEMELNIPGWGWIELKLK